MIRVGIFGYGNLGKGVECAVEKSNDGKKAELKDRTKHMEQLAAME